MGKCVYNSDWLCFLDKCSENCYVRRSKNLGKKRNESKYARYYWCRRCEKWVPKEKAVLGRAFPKCPYCGCKLRTRRAG